MDSNNTTALRKRTQITKTNRNMLIVVVVASIVVGVSIVASVFLVQRIMHEQKVISAKAETESILVKNNKTIPELESKIKTLNSNQALIDSKAKPSDDALQVILDALPSEANSLAVGGSLEKKIISGIDGMTLDSLKVNPVIGIELISDTGEVATAESAGKISFIYSVKGSIDSLQALFEKLEKSIRVFDTDSVRIENQKSQLVLTVEGHTYYEPAVKIKITEEPID